jgi:hypothetical protein
VLATALEEPVAFQGDEVMMHGAGGGEPHGIRDLADRWRVATLSHRLRDAVDDSLPALDVMPGQPGPSAICMDAP